VAQQPSELPSDYQIHVE